MNVLGGRTVPLRITCKSTIIQGPFAVQQRRKPVSKLQAYIRSANGKYLGGLANKKTTKYLEIVEDTVYGGVCVRGVWLLFFCGD